MPPTEEPEKSLHEVVDELGAYPIEAFEFVQHGLSYTVNKLHGPGTEEAKREGVSRHVSGQQLCQGLRQYALMQWGMLAGVVLRRWNITCTFDFGRIVFALISAGYMQKTDRDTLEDFRNVYDFHSAFDTGYQIETKA